MSTDRVLNLHYHQHGGAFEDCSRVECAAARRGLPAFTLEPQDTARAPMALDAGSKAREIVRALAEQGPWVRDGECVMCGADLTGSAPHDAGCVYARAVVWVEALL